MLKNLIIRIVLLLILFSSLLSIYRQIMVIRSAQSSLNQLETKEHRLELRNNALQQALK